MENFVVGKIDKNSKKIAAFDFDWTLVKPKSGRKFPKDSDDWEWLFPNIQHVIQNYHKQGFTIVIFTNQTKQFKLDQINNVLIELKVPVVAMIAFGSKSVYRKPSTKMFEKLFEAEEFPKKSSIDFQCSLFVGDAIGRPGDWSDSDLIFAKSVGLRCLSPEQIFGGQSIPNTEGIPDVNIIHSPMSIITNPIHQPVRYACNFNFDFSKQKMYLMVGYPGSGKSTFTRHFFVNERCVVLVGDVLKTPAKTRKELKTQLGLGFSVVIDATHPTIERRMEYIQIANIFGIPSICVHIDTSYEVSTERNNGRDKRVPRIALSMYKKRFIEPSIDEGFESIIRVN